MSYLLLLIVLALTVHRVTRLLVRDQIPLIATPRGALVSWLDPRDEQRRQVEPSPLGGFGRAVAYGLECDWCASVWVGGGLVWATSALVDLPHPLLVWPAVSTCAGLIADLEYRIEQQAKLTSLDQLLRREQVQQATNQEVEI